MNNVSDFYCSSAAVVAACQPEEAANRQWQEVRGQVCSSDVRLNKDQGLRLSVRTVPENWDAFFVSEEHVGAHPVVHLILFTRIVFNILSLLKNIDLSEKKHSPHFVTLYKL